MEIRQQATTSVSKDVSNALTDSSLFLLTLDLGSSTRDYSPTSGNRSGLIGTAGTHGTPGTHGNTGGLGTTGTTGLDNTGTAGTHGTHGAHGHDTNLGTTGTYGSHDTAAAPKKASLLDKLNPKKDADGDGKPGFMK